MRKITLIALLIVCCFGGAAFAQEATPQFCGTLAQDDCAILQKSQQAMAGLDSASFAAQVDITVSNVPDLKGPLTINITGSGSYGGMGKLRDDMTSAATTAATDPSQLIVKLLTDLDADFSITFNLSPEAMQQLGVQMRDSSITVQERLVDGIGYLNLDTLQALMGSGGSSLKGWYGLDLANLVKAAIQQMPQMFNNSMGNMGMMQDYQKAFSDPDFMNRFVKIERSDDGSTSTATFDITLNLGTLMGSPEFQSMMRQQMQTQNPSMSDDAMNQAMAMESQMFKGIDVKLSEDISSDDGYVQSIKGNFSFDSTGMMATMNNPSSASASATPKFSIDFTYTYSNFNDAPTITAPPNAIIIPYQSLLRPSVSA